MGAHPCGSYPGRMAGGFLKLARAMILVMALAGFSRLEARDEAAHAWTAGVTGAREVLLAAAIDAESGNAAETEGWLDFVKEHKGGVMTAAGALAGILLISAAILTFVVRRAKRQEDTPPPGTKRPGTAPSRFRSEWTRSGARGERAFPLKTAEGSARPARSGDTTPLSSGDEGGEPSSPPVSPSIQWGKLWMVLVAWGCLVVGLAVMILFPGSYAACLPLFLIAVLLAVTAMTRHLVLHGSLVLAALYLSVAVVWLVQQSGSDAESRDAKKVAGAARPAEAQDLPLATPARSPEAPVGRWAPPSVWQQVKPEDKTLLPTTSPQPPPPAPSSAATTPPPAMLLPDMPPLPPKADDALIAYRARLSHADHLDQNGVDLRNAASTTFGEILLQERLHVHQQGRRDPEDTLDAEFGSFAFQDYRALFERKPLKLPPNVLLFQLLKDDVIVDVQVFAEFIRVNLVSAQ